MENEQIENLCRLIDAFETDDAIEVLCDMVESTHGAEVDGILAEIRIALGRHDHTLASVFGRRLMETVKGMPPVDHSARRKRILVIDDMPDVLDTVKAMLKDTYSVYGVTDHGAALRFLSNSYADLILLDIEMPGMDGFELLGVIRKIAAYEKTPILFFTGQATAANVTQSRLKGATGFIRKPMDARLLRERIGKYLGTA